MEENRLNNIEEPNTDESKILDSSIEKTAEENTADPDKRNSRLEAIYKSLPDPNDGDFWDIVDNTPVSKGRKKRAIAVLLVVLFIFLLASYMLAIYHGKGWLASFVGNDNIEFTLPLAETPDLDDKYMNDDGAYTAAGVAKATLPSVVQIKSFSENSVTPSSQGSGIIMSEDGYILTNAHVIKSADYGITVVLYNNVEYSASVVGSDDSTDIAVLKIGATGLSPATFADSDECELGDEVVAIGSPAGYENSVTKGIISGLDRNIKSEGSAVSMKCIQIDAAINPGNSGGPLFNMYGQVIGITSSKLVSSSYDNMGFAITINSAKPIIEELMENGYIPDRGRIGISYYAISTEQAEMYGLVQGIRVVEIDSECNVAQTNLQPYDIITEINGVGELDEDKIADIMSELKAGDTVTCKVYRPSDSSSNTTGDGEEFEITFELNSDKDSLIVADESSEDSTESNE